MRVTSSKILGVGFLAAIGAWLAVAAPVFASVGEMEPLRYKSPAHAATATSSGGAAWIAVGLALAIVLAVTVAVYSRSPRPPKQSRALSKALPTAR